MRSRWAIHASVIVVCARSRRASFTFSLSPLRRNANSLSFHPRFFNVSAHETPGMHLPARLLASLRQRRQEHLPVLLPTEYLLPPVPAIHHMINGPGILNASFARHTLTPSQNSQEMSMQKVSIVRTDTGSMVIDVSIEIPSHEVGGGT